MATKRLRTTTLLSQGLPGGLKLMKTLKKDGKKTPRESLSLEWTSVTTNSSISWFTARLSTGWSRARSSSRSRTKRNVGLAGLTLLSVRSRICTQDITTSKILMKFLLCPSSSWLIATCTLTLGVTVASRYMLLTTRRIMGWLQANFTPIWIR